MNKRLKKWLGTILLAGTAACLCLGFASCGGDGEYPDFINPTGSVGPNTPAPGENSYIVNTVSAGGLSLDGIRVTASKDGATVMAGISVDGYVELPIEPGVYDLSYDNLPLGYRTTEETITQTTPDDLVIDATFTSSVIETTAGDNNTYQVGQVMYDFRWTDSDGQSYVLSELLQEKKMVVLNFWYIGCGPCRNEFPAIQEAYEAYKDRIEFLAFSTMDTDAQIQSFRELNEYTFPMGRNSLGLASMFGVTSAPTTFIVDRYGVIAMRETGGQPNAVWWKNTFAQFCSDDYAQKAPEQGDPSNPEEPLERPKPTEQMPASDVIAASLSGENIFATYGAETNPNDAPYSWPFLPRVDDEDGRYVAASNEDKDYSFSTLYAYVPVVQNDVVTVEVKLDTEYMCDYLYIFVDGELVVSLSGQTDGWERQRILISNRSYTAEIAFMYYKDEADESEDAKDVVRMRNLTLVNALDTNEPNDVLRECAVELDADHKRYRSYVNAELYTKEQGGDGYYHIYDEDTGSWGPIILLEFNDYRTPWRTAHLDSDTGTIQGETYRNSLYEIAAFQFSNLLSTDRDSALVFTLNGKDYTDLVIENYYLDMWSQNGLLPVYPELKQLIDDFLTQFNERFNQSAYAHENQWLEFCYYYDHYGDPHPTGGCFETIDPVAGMSFRNALTAHLGTNHNVITNGMQVHPGTRYRFTAEEDGVYLFESKTTDPNVDPLLYLRREEGGDYGENYIDTGDDSRDYDAFTASGRKYGFNFRLYRYMTAGESIILQCAMKTPGDTGEYDFEITNLGADYTTLLFCTTEDGLWTYHDSGPLAGTLYYLAIQTGLNSDNVYYPTTADGEYFNTPVYIDFLHPNYYEPGGRTLLQMVNSKIFDFSRQGGRNYTPVLLELYESSIQGREEDDPLYGLTPATKELVDILYAQLIRDPNIEAQQGDDSWLMFGVYFENFRNPAARNT